MNPGKVILATMVIFVCGLISGVLLVKTTSPNPHPIAAADVLPAPVLSSNAPAQAPANPMVVTRTNVVWAPFQAQRMVLIRQMVNRLHLNPEQRERIGQIIKDSQERSKELWQEIAPQMHDELKRVTEDIRHELGPQQQHRFMEMLRENRRENHQKQGLANTNTAQPPEKMTNNPDPSSP